MTIYLMRKKLVLFFLVLSSLFFVQGCNGNSTPVGILGFALKYVEKHDLEGFKSTLSRLAIEKFGNQNFLEVLEKKINLHKKEEVDIEKVNIQTTKHAYSVEWTNVYVVTVRLESTGEVLGTATVICDSAKKVRGRPKHSLLDIKREITETHCLVDDLKFE